MDMDVLEGLQELKYPMDENQLKKAVVEGPLTPEYTKCVEWLTKEIKYLYNLDERVNAINAPEDTSSFLFELSSFLRELGCLYKSLTEGSAEERLKSRKDRLKLLDYLIHELFGARMASSKGMSFLTKKTGNLTLTINESPTAASLKKLMMSLKISKPPDDVKATVLFSAVTAKVKDLSGRCISAPLFTGTLTDKQWTALEKVNDELQEEYRIRRRMILKRLDVTIQSFQWSDRMVGREDEIAKVHLERRSAMTVEPSVQLSDFLAARHHLAVLEKTSSANVRKNTKTAINSFIIGKVPDRGGRPREQQPPPPEMPSWAPRASQPQGGGGSGYGGGRGGRGGGGDRGGRVQGGWNSGGGGGGYRGGRGGRGGNGGGYSRDRRY